MYLMDSATVAYAEGRERRIVVANLLSGEGWERQSASGEEGPGSSEGRR
jgi:hypothetical protein